MSLIEFQTELTKLIKQSVKSHFNIELEFIAAENPPKTEFGDLAFPVAFELAKQIKQQTGEKQNPRAMAEKLREDLLTADFVKEIQIAGPGYLNVFYNRKDLLSVTLEKESFIQSVSNSLGRKICVEHTSVNPNKAAHIGHVRNSVLGDTFVRILQADGNRVEVQNYIDNTGVQVADVVIGFIHLEKMNLADIKKLDEELKEQEISFDYYCWDLYARVGVEYQQNEKLKERRAETIHLIEEGENELAELADYVATRNVECILNTMERLSIRYDLLPRESEILHLNFWKKAFEMMQERKVISFVKEGKMKECWVMPFESQNVSDDHNQDKILVRSNGTVTYTGKDIAYQMWKLGLLGLDFYYKKFSTYENGQEVWVTTSQKNEEDHPEFGNSKTVYNVIDTRQSYPQEVVKKGVATIFPDTGEDVSVHLSYEMVALSPEAAVELGFEISEEDKKKSFIEMSGRKGLGVKADDLINRLIEKAYQEVVKGELKRLEGDSDDIPLDENQKRKIAGQIAIGSLRYFLLKFTKNTLIVFDFEEALNFKGETGAYCQNATVRLNSIFRKLEANALEKARDLIKNNPEKVMEIFENTDGQDFWGVIITALRLEENIKQAIESSEPAVFAKYTFNLAKTFNLFYQKHNIKNEEDEFKKALMISTAEIARKALTDSLQILGIQVPEKM
jgi:arginyl-tRNA synthetase